MDKSTKDQFQYGLGAGIVLAFFIVVGLLLFHPVPAENQRAFDITLGALTGMLLTVVGYFFGSSKGSSEKNDMLAQK